jgi:aspartyl-tRNA(Asn)/glutamyl-tRNA(Gln) amidotransferase subunit C
MSLDPAAVRRIARLARLRVSDAEVVQMQTELNSILGWIDQLNELNVEGVEPLTGGTSIALRQREDVVTEPDLTEAVLSNAPERDGPFYTVPKVVE